MIQDTTPQDPPVDFFFPTSLGPECQPTKLPPPTVTAQLLAEVSTMAGTAKQNWVCAMASETLPLVSFDTVTTVDRNTLESSLGVEQKDCGLLLRLTLGSDVGGGDVPVDVQLIDVDTCNQGVLQIAMPVISTTLEGVPVSQADYFGRLMCMLGSLLKCCPPCAETLLTQGDINGYNKIDFSPSLVAVPGAPYGFRVCRLVFSQVSDPNQAWGYLAKPDIQLLGKMRLLSENQELREVFFINSSPQEVKIDRDDIVGISYWIYPGQTLHLKTYVRPVWEHPTPP
jgi:hypothetical protein